MGPVIDDHDVTVWQGDARTVLRQLPAGSVQCICTSPPYFGLRDYGVAGQIGLEPSPADYVEQLRAVFAEARRVLAVDGVMFLNLGDSYANGSSGGTQGATGVRASRTFTAAGSGGFSGVPPKNLLGMPWRTAFALQNDGWYLRNDIIWAKPNAMPESVTDRLSTRHEHVFLFTRSRRYTFNLDAIREARQRDDRSDAIASLGSKQRCDVGSATRQGRNASSVWNTGSYQTEGRNPGDVWSIPTTPTPYAHFATMPPELARRCIQAGSPEGGTVLDPFAGSGTTLMVARQLGRRAVGVELNPGYVDIIRRRIGQEPLNFDQAAVI